MWQGTRDLRVDGPAGDGPSGGPLHRGMPRQRPARGVVAPGVHLHGAPLLPHPVAALPSDSGRKFAGRLARTRPARAELRPCV